jgi:hypothetical protein
MLKTKRYNPSYWTRKKLGKAMDDGLIVVCAPRPIPGLETWQGDWCCGVFWAIGDESFLPKWEALDATQIELVSNDQLVEEAKQRLAEFKAKYPDYKNDWDSMLVRASGDLKSTVKGILQDACWNDDEEASRNV